MEAGRPTNKKKYRKKSNNTIFDTVRNQLFNSIRAIAGNKFLIQLLEVNFVALADDV